MPEEEAQDVAASQSALIRQPVGGPGGGLGFSGNPCRDIVCANIFNPQLRDQCILQCIRDNIR